MNNAQGSALIAGIEARAWNGVPIQRRQSDGFVNATAMCRAGGKRWNDYARVDRTREYICALAVQIGAQIPCAASVAGFPATGIHGLIDVIRGGRPELQGTWIHPRLAVDLARWISPAFAVWMDGWFLEALAAQRAPAPAPAPAAAAPRRRRAPRQAPVPMARLAVEVMDDERLKGWAGHLKGLLWRRQQGDPRADGVIRLYAWHLLLSCDRPGSADDLEEAMSDWSVTIGIETCPDPMRNAILANAPLSQLRRLGVV